MRPSADEAARDKWLTRMSVSSSDVAATESERRALHDQHLQSHLMKMSVSCITSQLSLSQLEHMNLRFQRYDTSNDGRLSHIEMRQVLEDVGIKGTEEAELIIESLDGDHSGMIEYSEFVSGCLDMAADVMKKHLRVAFGIFDLDHSGSLSVQELRQVLTQGPNCTQTLARPISPPTGKAQPPGKMASTILPDGKTVEEVMKDMDKDGKGKIEYSEFEAYLLAEHRQAGARLHGETKETPPAA